MIDARGERLIHSIFKETTVVSFYIKKNDHWKLIHWKYPPPPLKPYHLL